MKPFVLWMWWVVCLAVAGAAGRQARAGQAGAVQAVPLEGKPNCLVADKERVYVGIFTAGVGVAVVDRGTRRVRAYIPADPRGAVSDLAIAKGKLFVAQSFSPFVLAFDLRTRKLLKRLRFPTAEGALAASPDGKRVYFATGASTHFTIIDAATYACRRISYPRTGQPPQVLVGCRALLPSRDGTRVYLGINRPLAWLAVYNLKKRFYEAETSLESAGPGCVADMALSRDGKQLFLGMFQSVNGVFAIGTRNYGIEANIPFASRHPTFRWADPLGVAVYGDKLVVVNRHNYELVILQPRPVNILARVPLGGEGNGPSKLVVLGHQAAVVHNERKALLFVDLRRALGARVQERPAAWGAGADKARRNER